MKLLVFGHSDSDGSHLLDPADSWPRVLQRSLSEAGGEVDVLHRRLYAGPTAAEYVERQFERERPDVVVMATSTYAVVVRLVSNHVRERWGDRAAAAALRLEQFAGRHPGRPGSPGAAAITVGRRLGRKLIGTRPALAADGLIEHYRDCMRSLARHEDVRTIILGGAGFTREVGRLNPGFDSEERKIQERLRDLALSHRFAWLVHEDLLGGPAGKARFFLSDGMHTDEHSQRLVADAILPMVAHLMPAKA